MEKFVTDEQTRNILCDAIGDIMSLIHEYARNKENRIIKNLLIAGNFPQKIAKDADIPLSRVKEIERKIKNVNSS